MAFVTLKPGTLLAPVPAVMVSCAPVPTASMAMTAPTPMTIPRMVSPERILFEFRLSNASMIACQRFIANPPRPGRLST